MKLTVDFETRSVIDLTLVGAWRYAQHPNTEIMCMSLKADDNLPVLWVPEKFRLKLEDHQLPLISTEDLIKLVENCNTVEAHNAEFERSLWTHKLSPVVSLPPLTKWRCSAAKAALHALPRKLAKVAEVLELDERKDDEGHRLMLQMSKPRKPRKAEVEACDGDVGGKLFWFEDSERLKRFFQYCVQDVVVEHEASKTLRDLPFAEQEVYFMDQRINQNGMYIDLDTMNMLSQMMDDKEVNLRKEFQELTDGIEATQRDKLMTFFEVNKLKLANLTKLTVHNTLQRDDLEPNLRRVLEIKQQLSKSSTAKYTKLRDMVCQDGRIRGYLLYHGAATGRWAGRFFQPQNLPRGDFEVNDELHELVNLGDYEAVESHTGHSIFVVASTMLRSLIAAPPGKDLISADYSAIEARVLAWLAGEEKVNKFFHKYDEGKSDYDLYMLAASDIYGKSPKDIDKKERQVGKVVILACGYQGSVGAFQSMALNYDVKVTDEAAKAIVKQWRGNNQMITSFWYELERAITSVIRRPDTTRRVGKVVVGVDRNFLCIRLPSKRVLYYYQPKVEMVMKPWGEPGQAITFGRTNGLTKQWERTVSYGGKFVENVTQAVARDLMAEGMFRTERVGYLPILTVHDEVLSEIEEGKGDLKEFENLLATVPRWAEGLPLAAEGWRAKRYRK